MIEDDNKDNDYPILAVKAHETYTNQKADGLLLLCGTGVGMNIVANKFKGIRSVLATSEEYAYFQEYMKMQTHWFLLLAIKMKIMKLSFVAENGKNNKRIY